MAADPSDDADTDSQWRFSLSDLEEATDEDAAVTGDAESESDSEDSGGNIAGSFTIDEELEAGDISAENALFVAVGVVLAIGFVLGFLTLLP
jgi:hypothetical protein